MISNPSHNIFFAFYHDVFIIFSEQNFINEVFAKMKHLYTRVVRTQFHLDLIKETIQSWGKYPMYYRKEIPQGSKNLLNISEQSVIMAYRQVNCESTKRMRDKFIYINLKLFSGADLEANEEKTVVKRKTRTSLKADTQIFNEQENDAQIEGDDRIYTPEDLAQLLSTYPVDYQKTFIEYMKYFDMEIGEELAAAISVSTTYLKKEINAKGEENAAVFEIVMELQEPNIAFFPSIEIGHKLSLLAKVTELLKDIYVVMNWIPRLVDGPRSEDLDYDGEFEVLKF